MLVAVLWVHLNLKSKINMENLQPKRENYGFEIEVGEFESSQSSPYRDQFMKKEISGY